MYSAFPKAPALQEPRHKTVQCYIQDTLWEVLLLYRDAVGVFCIPSRLSHPEDSLEESYPSVEMHSVYSEASAEPLIKKWKDTGFIIPKKFWTPPPKKKTCYTHGNIKSIKKKNELQNKTKIFRFNKQRISKWDRTIFRHWYQSCFCVQCVVI